jgi:hypothetical protein
MLALAGGIKMHPGVKDQLACRGFVCRTLHRLGLNVETIKPNSRPAGWHWIVATLKRCLRGTPR